MANERERGTTFEAIRYLHQQQQIVASSQSFFFVADLAKDAADAVDALMANEVAINVGQWQFYLSPAFLYGRSAAPTVHFIR